MGRRRTSARALNPFARLRLQEFTMKRFRVISVRCDCGAKPPRLAQETLATYTTRLQKIQRWHLHRATLTALDAIAKEADENASIEREAAVTFITAPEFYWSTPWHALRNICEVRELPALQIDPVRSCVAKVAAQFPLERYGRLVFLPGTAAMPFDAQPIDETHTTPLFESLNYLYAATNFIAPLATQTTQTTQATHGLDASLPRAVAWPKRSTSSIDYGMREREFDTPRTWTLTLGDGTRIDVLKPSDTDPPAHDGRIADMFDNRLDDVPLFGVDVHRQTDNAREPAGDFTFPPPDDPHHMLDFVLSYGVDLDAHCFEKTESLRYIVHNDGRRQKEVAVLAIDERAHTSERVPDASATRHLTLGERSHVSIHEFTLDAADASHDEPATER
jgi:hypothetical protein